jgi:hypothetical protein
MTLHDPISPPDPNRLDDPEHWRDKAEQARLKAAAMFDQFAREVMEGVAAAYDLLAVQAEGRSEGLASSPLGESLFGEGNWP